MLTEVENNPIGLIAASGYELLFLVGMVTVHEVIHYLVGRKQGHNPRFGLRFVESIWFLKEPSPYVATFNEHITRNENINSLIEPLIIIDLVALIALLPVFPPVVAYYAKIALVVNTASSMQDIYNAVRIANMPEGTKYINILEDDVRTFYCKPLNED